MKTLLLTFILALSFTFTQAQCIENVSNFGNNNQITSYNISGDVNLTLNANKTATLNFGSNFSTAMGPDVRVYLVDSKDKSISDIKNIKTNPSGDLIFEDNSLVDNIAFGLIGFSGAQNYTVEIPANKDISNYDTVFFFCLQFNQYWDSSSYNSFTNASCAVLSTNDINSLNKTSIYPNPTQHQFKVSNLNGTTSSIRVYNMLGEQIIYTEKENTVNVSDLKPGSYIVKISNNGKTKTEKLIIL